MIEIFVPVLWICINANCEFMQGGQNYTRELECRRDVENQKAKIRKLSRSAKSQVEVLEGTCVSISIQRGMI
jgi:hypothetical protein